MPRCLSSDISGMMGMVIMIYGGDYIHDNRQQLMKFTMIPMMMMMMMMWFVQEEEIVALGMGAYMGVAQGAVFPPKFIHLTYK